MAYALPADAETRVALVIGNGAYRSIAELSNPPNDARDVGDALKALGFAVQYAINADQARMREAIAEFSRKAAAADVSLFYYGGHGLQVAAHNYLVPVDAEFHTVDDIDTRTVHFDDVLQAQAQGSGIHLIFLDACRNNPVKTLNIPQQSAGLARVGEAAGLMIAFATQPDNVAYDGAGRNSPFTQAFLSHVATPGIDVSAMMIAVRRDVIAATGGAQVPWENSSLTRQFFFAGASAQESTPEGLLWQVAAKDRDRNLLTIYLDRYPKGPHSEDARSLMTQAPPTGAPPPPAVEDDLWRLALGSRQRALVELYLARYPEGAHVGDANALLAALRATEAAAKDAGVVCERLATVPADATASAPGVDLATLAKHASEAIEACSKAAADRPDIAHYVALLARAKIAAGAYDEAIQLYRKAADAGDARAMVSLGLLMEDGDHLPKDVKGAYALYEKAAERGNADGAINLGVALRRAKSSKRTRLARSRLFKQAAEAGSARATYRSGGLDHQRRRRQPRGRARAVQASRRASANPPPIAPLRCCSTRAAARQRTRRRAANEMLRCVYADSGECLAELVSRAQTWTPDTIKAIQTTLKAAGYYSGPITGRTGPELGPALKQWRLLGAPSRG